MNTNLWNKKQWLCESPIDEGKAALCTCKVRHIILYYVVAKKLDESNLNSGNSYYGLINYVSEYTVLVRIVDSESMHVFSLELH